MGLDERWVEGDGLVGILERLGKSNELARVGERGRKGEEGGEGRRDRGPKPIVIRLSRGAKFRCWSVRPVTIAHFSVGSGSVVVRLGVARQSLDRLRVGLDGTDKVSFLSTEYTQRQSLASRSKPSRARILKARRQIHLEQIVSFVPGLFRLGWVNVGSNVVVLLELLGLS